MAREQVDPLRKRVEHVRRELGDAEEQAARTLSQILSAGILASPTAKKLLADAEERQAQLRAALAQAEGELATRETDQLDLQVMIDAIRGFDVAFDHLPLAEKREFLQLMCKQVEVHKDHLVVELYQGHRAARYLATNPSVVAAGEREARAQKHETPDS